eukprot:15442388-Alexandrium_andersonii.AAC.1
MPLSCVQPTRVAIRSALLKAVSAFNHRVTSRLDGLQYQVLWFAYKDAAEPCSERRRVAHAILHTEESLLNVTVRKVKRVFTDDLTAAADTGKASTALYFAFRLLGP